MVRASSDTRAGKDVLRPSDPSHLHRLFFLHRFFFFFNDTATTEIYTLSLHDALPIYSRCLRPGAMNRPPSSSRARYSLPSPASRDIGIAHSCTRPWESAHLSSRPQPLPWASRVSATTSSRPQMVRRSP